MKVRVIGGGLAGSECALQLAKRGVDVILYEQRGSVKSPAHHTDNFAELVCSNSLKALRHESAAGLLKEELEVWDSFLLKFAKMAAVPAGGALSVDREKFSELVNDAIMSSPRITIERRRVDEIPEGQVVIAAGPLCADDLLQALSEKVGNSHLSFFDAAAPIVDAETINRDIIFSQSRYDEESQGDYLNCPFEKDSYLAFWEELVAAKRTISKEFEEADLFQACQPVEEVARKGVDTLRFGALKPVGLTDPKTGRRPYAAVQLRSENADNTAYNLVGFQTNLTWPEQKRVFRMIPGLEEAEFFRYGVMHRNTFVDSPRVLDATFKIPNTTIRLAGQITGTEGYCEAIASGLLAALNTYANLQGLPEVELPKTTALGSLVAYATNPATDPYQPMHVNFGLVPPLDVVKRSKKERYGAYADRALADMVAYANMREDLR